MHLRPAVRCANLALVSVLAAGSAFALELPIRKNGLWESTSSTSANPGVTARVQQCVGEDTDRAAMAKAEATWLKMGCPKSEPQKLGAAYSYDSSCKLGASTMKTHSVLTYPSDASIHSVTTVDSGDGTAAVTNTSDARWLGPCKPGQKPGDHQVMNLDELTKPH